MLLLQGSYTENLKSAAQINEFHVLMSHTDIQPNNGKHHEKLHFQLKQHKQYQIAKLKQLHCKTILL